ncbi:MAG: metal ABC transporter substrate-binding protein [Candidatus Caldarchaeales archaeon]
MKKDNRHRHLSILIIPLFLISILKGSSVSLGIDEAEVGKITVVTVVEPIASVVREIGGERVDVITIIPPNVDPHDYEPPTGTLIEKLSQARLLVVSGRHHLIVEEKIYELVEEGLLRVKLVGYGDYVDNGLKQLVNPKTNDLNPHGYYYSISGLRAIASTVASSLAEIDRDYSEYYRGRLSKYLESIDSLEKKIRATLDKHYRVIIYSPILQYLINDLGLEQVDIVVSEHDIEPSERDISNMFTRLKNGDADLVIFTDEEAVKNQKLIDLLRRENLRYVVVPVAIFYDTPELISLSASVLISSQSPTSTYSNVPLIDPFTLLWLSIIVNIVLTVMVIFLIIRLRRIGR